MNKQRKTSNILNVFQYDEATGIIGLNGVPVSGYGLYLHTNINDGSVGIDSSSSINALYLLKSGTKQFEISYDTSGVDKIFRLLPYQSGSFFQIGNPSNAGANYVFISEPTYGNVLIGPGIGNGTGNLTGATAATHKIQFNGAVFANSSIQATSFKITGGAGTGFLKADGSVDTVTYLSGNQTITVSGDASGSGTTSINLTLANTAVTPGTYGSSTLVPVVTVDSKGRITNVSTASISGALTFTGDVTGTGTTGSSTSLTLANSGVTAGTYTKVTVDSKGRVTVGANATTSDISEGTNLYYTDARVLAYLGANNYATQSYVTTQINNLVAGAPGLLDTLDELAAALGDDANFATTTATSLGNRLRIDTGAQGLTSTQQGYGRTNLGLGSLATLSSIGNSYITDLAWSKLSSTPTTISGYGITNAYTDAQIQNFFNGANAISGYNKSNWDTAYGWGNHASAGYLTTSSAASTYVSLTGSYANPSWITSLAYSKITGVPAFLTSYTETDTLATVTSRGSSTSTTLNLDGRVNIGNGLTRPSALNSDSVAHARIGGADVHLYVASLGAGGGYKVAIQSARTSDFASFGLDLQANGGTLFYGGNEVATRTWVTSQGYITSSGSITGDAGTIGGISASRIVYGDNSTATTYISNATLDGALKSGFYTVGSGGIPNASSVNFVLHTAYYGVGNLAGFDLACNDSTTSQFYLRPATGAGKGAWQTIVTNSGTWGISITGNAATLGGYGPNQTGGAYTIVQRDANGYIQNSYFYMSGGGSERNSSGLGYIAGFNSSDYYVRSYNSTAVASFLGLGSMAYASTGSYLPLSGGSLSGKLQINANWGGTNPERFTIRGTYPSIVLRSTNHDMNWLIHNDDNLSIYSAAGVDSDSWGLRMRLNTSGVLQVNGNTVLTAGNYTSYTYSTTDADGRFLRGTTNPGSVNNFTISIGNNGTYSYVQSHSGQPLRLNPVGNTIYLDATTYAGSNLYANIIYDQNNSGYYLDPDSTSNVNAITMAGTLFMNGGAYYGTILFGGSSYWRAGISQRDAGNAELRIWAKGGGAGSIYFATNFDGESSSTALPSDGMALKNNNLGLGSWGVSEFPSYKLHIKGTAYATSDFRSPQFLFTNSTNNAYFTGNSDWGVRLVNDNGYILFGPANNSWTHIYSDKSFYFNQQLYVNGTQVVTNSGSWSITSTGNVYARGQSNWNDSTVISNVIGLLAWKNYGGNHVIFDASNGTSPSGGGVSQTNATYAWSASYPTLMGWNGSNTYGVRVDSARVADTSGNSSTTSQRSFDYLYASSYLESGGAVYGTIFYDNNDRGYYLDPNTSGTALRIAGSIFSDGAFGTNGASAGGTTSRIFAPKGAAYSYTPGGVTGAIKIRLPIRANDTMWSMKVRIYDYNVNKTSEYLLGNYAYSAGAWNYSATYLGGSASIAHTVRFGNEGGYDCVWIGETSTGWSHPVISVMDFMGGYANGSTGNWQSNWEVTIVSSFGTVGASVAPNINFNEVYAYSYRGNSNVAGTGTASYHPSGIYSTGTNWLYGTMYMNGNSINDVSNLYSGAYYATNWFRAQGDCGLYSQDYGGHFRRSSAASHGTWEIFGYNKGSYAGLNIIDPQGNWNNLMFESGNGGVYQQNGDGWLWYWSRGNSCLGVGSSSTTSGYKLRVNGATHSTGLIYCESYVQASGAGYFGGDVTAYYSDVRLKENVKPLENVLEKLNKIGGYTYTANDLALQLGAAENKDQRLGVLAQEIKEVFPEVVAQAPFDRDALTGASVSGQDYMTVKYERLVPVLIEAIKEQQKQIEELQNKLDNVLSSR